MSLAIIDPNSLHNLLVQQSSCKRVKLRVGKLGNSVMGAQLVQQHLGCTKASASMLPGNQVSGERTGRKEEEAGVGEEADTVSSGDIAWGKAVWGSGSC